MCSLLYLSLIKTLKIINRSKHYPSNKKTIPTNPDKLWGSFNRLRASGLEWSPLWRHSKMKVFFGPWGGLHSSPLERSLLKTLKCQNHSKHYPKILSTFWIFVPKYSMYRFFQRIGLRPTVLFVRLRVVRVRPGRRILLVHQKWRYLRHFGGIWRWRGASGLHEMSILRFHACVRCFGPFCPFHRATRD